MLRGGGELKLISHNLKPPKGTLELEPSQIFKIKFAAKPFFLLLDLCMSGNWSN